MLRRLDPLGIAAALFAVAGILLIHRGVDLIFQIWEIDHTELRAGQRWVLLGAALSVLAAAPLILRKRWQLGLLVASPGLVCAALAYSFPGLAFLIFWPLAFLALVAALSGSFRRRFRGLRLDVSEGAARAEGGPRGRGSSRNSGRDRLEC